jgi:hypothetical protein
MFERYPFDPFDVILTDSRFEINFRPLKRIPSSWYNELVTATNLYHKIEKSIYLGLSGGIDSEIIARLFIQEKVKFTPLILEYYHDRTIINEHDIQYAKRFCQENNITPLIHRVSVQKLSMMIFDEQYYRYYRVSGIYQYVQIYLVNLVESMNGFLVMGSGVQTWSYDSCLKFKVDSVYFNIYEYMNDKNITHWPSFFWTTPELIKSYSDIPLVQQAFNNSKKFKFKNHSNDIKKQVYQEFFPDIESREKYHGYEYFYKVSLYRKIMRELLNYEGSVTKILYNDFQDQFIQKR